MILQKAKTSTRSARLVEHERRNPNKTGEQIFFGDALSDFKNKLERTNLINKRSKFNYLVFCFVYYFFNS